MVKGGRVLIVGLMGAVFLCSVGYYLDWRQGENIKEIGLRCTNEAAIERAKSELDFQMLCDPLELFPLDERVIGVQKELVEAVKARDVSNTHHWYSAAIFFALALAIPYLWYFLLRRLREVRDAVTGRDST